MSHLILGDILEYGLQFLTSAEQERWLLNFMAYFLMVLAFAVLIFLCIYKAPYGRYANASWGFPVNAKLAWCVQETPAVVIPLTYMACIDSPQLSNTVNQLLLSLYFIHYGHRAFIYPFLIQGGKPTPVLPCLMALAFLGYNGFMQGRTLSTYAEYPSDWLTHPCFVIGIAVFFCGLFINVHSDYILRKLRKPGETDYKIPKGGMFQYVSGANFFGESLEWFGFALACCTVQALALAIFTACNIGMRACHHHQWYRKKFENYPKDRKAYIPYLF